MEANGGHVLTPLPPTAHRRLRRRRRRRATPPAGACCSVSRSAAAVGWRRLRWVARSPRSARGRRVAAGRSGWREAGWSLPLFLCRSSFVAPAPPRSRPPFPLSQVEADAARDSLRAHLDAFKAGLAACKAARAKARAPRQHRTLPPAHPHMPPPPLRAPFPRPPLTAAPARARAQVGDALAEERAKRPGAGGAAAEAVATARAACAAILDDAESALAAAAQEASNTTALKNLLNSLAAEL